MNSRDHELVQQMFGLAKKYPAVNHQENMLLLKAAKRLDELTRARALRWGDAVRRAYASEPAYITGYREGGMEYDAWAVLYTPHLEQKEPIYAIVNAGRMWTIPPDTPEVILWSAVPTAEQIEEEQKRRAEIYEQPTEG